MWLRNSNGRGLPTAKLQGGRSFSLTCTQSGEKTKGSALERGRRCVPGDGVQSDCVVAKQTTSRSFDSDRGDRGKKGSDPRERGAFAGRYRLA